MSAGVVEPDDRQRSTRFGELLLHHRLAAGLTQEKLAERAQLSPGAIGALERGIRSRPRRETIHLLATVLGLDPIAEARLEAAARPPRAVNWARHRADDGKSLSSAIAHQSALAVPPNNLPAQLTSFIGRAPQIELACQRLLRSDVRLLTLIGPGGCGKSRLGLQIATALVEHFSDGTYYVPLAPVTDPDLVAAAIAQVLALRESASRSLSEAVRAYLAERELLLLLDNFEQVVEAAPRVAELLAACPRLKVLVTSRAPLRITGEHELAVPSLGLPNPTTQSSFAELTRSEAVQLFVERAQAVRADFALTADNGPTVAKICQRLDGLPLAIELAAARIKLIAPPVILGRLTDRFALLTGGTRDAPARQRTLRATIDWSYDLLSEPEKVLFRRLSVFTGGWTLEAAEGVCGREDLFPVEILDLVTRLADKSVVTVADETSDEPRYRLLETIRQYAREKLREAGEKAVALDHHRDWYMGLVEQAEPELVGPREVEWLDRLEREHDNLRSVLEWCLGGEPQVGLRIAGGLWWFWAVRGYYTEGRRWLEAMLARAPEPTAMRAKALVGADCLAQYQADRARALSALEESLAISRETGDDAGIARALAELGIVIFNRGDYTRAYAVLEEGLAAAGRAGQPPLNTLWALNRLGVAAHLAGDLERARTLLDQGLALSRQVQSKRHLGWALGDLGELLVSLGSYANARPLLEEGLVVSREIGDRLGMAYRLLHLGNLLRIQNEHGRAGELLNESRERFEYLGSDHGLSLVRATLANLERSEGRYERARGLLVESLETKLTVQETRTISHRVWLMGMVEIALGLHARGARLIGAGNSHGLYQTILSPFDRTDADAALDLARSALGKETFTQTLAEGRAMTLEQAVADCLAKPVTVSRGSNLVQSPLSPREQEVARLIARGLTNRQLADALVISIRTADRHVANVLSKLGLTTRAQIATWAVRHNLADTN